MHKSGRVQTVSMGTPEEDNFKTQARTDGWILLKLIFKKYDWRNWSGFIWLIMKKSGGLLNGAMKNLGL